MSDSTPLFFKVIPRPAIWGGAKARTFFGYDVPDGTGQVWAFAAQPDGDTVCTEGPYTGCGLKELFETVPDMFASSYERFPFIISLVTPVDDLSVQVHPTDEVSRSMGFDHGKNEAWVMIDVDAGSSLVYGLEEPVPEAVARIESGDMDGLFRSVPTSKGECFYIPSGTVHALGRGNVAYEVQQSTDMTFRIFDYGRTDDQGRPRSLDTARAIESIRSAPSAVNETLDYVHPAERVTHIDGSCVTEHVDNDSFCISSISVVGSLTLSPACYLLCTVVDGEGNVNGNQVHFSDNFLVPANCGEVKLEGRFTLMVTSESSVLK